MNDASAARYRTVGALCAAAAAMLFASKGIFAKFAYARGVSFELLVIVRALIALPLFWGFALLRESAGTIRGTRWKAIGAAAFAGVLCYYVGAVIDFYALTLIDASIERVLIFSYPAMVVFLDAAIRRRPPSRSVLAAALITWIGVFFSVGGFDAREIRENLLGAACVLLAAATYAIYFMVGERYTREIGASRFTLFAMTAATLALVAHAAIRGTAAQVPALDHASWALLLGLGVLCMFVPALLQAEGVRRIGAQRGAIVSTAGPPTTLVLAWVFFGERLTLMQFFGMALIVAGILSLELARIARRRLAD